MCAQSLSQVRLSVTPQTVIHQALLSLGFSRQEYWSGLPFLPPGDLPDPGIEPAFPVSSALAEESPGGFFSAEPSGKPFRLQSVKELTVSQTCHADFQRSNNSVSGARHWQHHQEPQADSVFSDSLEGNMTLKSNYTFAQLFPLAGVPFLICFLARSQSPTPSSRESRDFLGGPMAKVLSSQCTVRSLVGELLIDPTSYNQEFTCHN